MESYVGEGSGLSGGEPKLLLEPYVGAAGSRV